MKTQIPRSAQCVSGLTIDAFLMGELSDTQASALHEHLRGCNECGRRYSEILLAHARARAALPPLRSFAPSAGARSQQIQQAALVGVPRLELAWKPLAQAGRSEPSTSEQAVFASKAAKPAFGNTKSVRPPRRKALWGLLAAACLGLFLSVNLRPTELQVTGLNVERLKGETQLGFFVRRDTQIIEGTPQLALRAGDQIQFSFSGKAGYLAILSLDGAGQSSVYYPTGEQAAAFSGGYQLLPQSTELDAVLGPELIVALHCNTPIPLEPLRVALSRGVAQLKPHAGCHLTTLTLNKSP